MSACRVPWCVLPFGHESDCEEAASAGPTREAIVEAFTAFLGRMDAIEARRLKPDVERALIVQAVRETVAGLRGNESSAR